MSDALDTHAFPRPRWVTLRERGGVTLRATGAGEPVFVFPGMEGSGESCLHLVAPVLEAAAGRGSPRQMVLVDYAAEGHATLDELVATASALVAEEAAGRTCTLWAQSFGNLLAASVAREPSLRVGRMVMVSPFTRLAPVRAHLGTHLMRATPRPVFRATIGPLGRVLFGPTGGEDRHPFFGALAAAPPAVAGRRTGWLRGLDFSGRFAEIQAPAHVWLGEVDRLVELRRQTEFFAGLARSRPGFRFSTIPGAGHVVLPQSAVRHARRGLLEWITAEG